MVKISKNSFCLIDLTFKTDYIGHLWGAIFPCHSDNIIVTEDKVLEKSELFIMVTTIH